VRTWTRPLPPSVTKMLEELAKAPEKGFFSGGTVGWARKRGLIEGNARYRITDAGREALRLGVFVEEYDL
jgi:DNA-binding PadR family transcriptional regulator